MQYDLNTRPLDAPPAHLVERHLPDLAARHREVIAACQAAREATAAANATRGGRFGAGQAWRHAQLLDDQLVDNGEPARHCAELAAQQPVLDAQADALARRAERLTRAWNADAAGKISKSGHGKLTKVEAELRAACNRLAAEALASASGLGGRQRVGRSTRRLVDDLEEAVEKWQEVAAVLTWALRDHREASRVAQMTWRSFAGRLPADPDHGPDERRRRAPTKVERALALVDPTRRSELKLREPATQET